jgi:O-antigen ligase
MVFILFVLMHYVWLIGTENIEQAKFLINKMKYGLYILIFTTFVQKEYFSKVIAGFIFGIFVSEFISYLIFFDIIPNSFYFYNEVIYQATPYDPTPFTNHIYYSIFLSFATSIILYNIIKINNWNSKKIIYMLFFITITINMFLQASRTGYILYFLMIIFTLIYIYKSKILKIIPIVLVIFSILSYLIYQNSNTFKERVIQTYNSINQVYYNENYDSSIGKRIGIYYYGIEAIKNNFLFGVGTGDIMDETFKQIDNNKDNHLEEMTTLHNEFLNAQLRFGIFGPIVLLYLFYLIFTFKQENDYLNFILKSSSFIVFISMLPGDFFQGWMIIFWIIPLSISTINLNKNYDTITNRYTKEEIKFYIYIFIFSYISSFTNTIKYWGKT